jgi:hypothetical protein
MNRSRGILAAVVFLPVLAGGASAKICPQIVRPVCALTKAHQLTTFNNACMAANIGATVLHQGECFGTHCPHIITNGGACARSAISGKVKWYDNLCWAEKDWAIFLHNGPASFCH